MEDYRRPPTPNERIFAIVASALLSVLLGALAILFAIGNFWVVAAVPAALAMVMLVIFYRAAFGPRQALGARATTSVAWGFVIIGTAGIALALLVGGKPQHRLMALAGFIPVLSAGLSWLGGRRRGV